MSIEEISANQWECEHVRQVLLPWLEERLKGQSYLQHQQYIKDLAENAKRDLWAMSLYMAYITDNPQWNPSKGTSSSDCAKLNEEEMMGSEDVKSKQAALFGDTTGMWKRPGTRQPEDCVGPGDEVEEQSAAYLPSWASSWGEVDRKGKGAKKGSGSQRRDQGASGVSKRKRSRLETTTGDEPAFESAKREQTDCRNPHCEGMCDLFCEEAQKQSSEQSPGEVTDEGPEEAEPATKPDMDIDAGQEGAQRSRHDSLCEAKM